MAVTYAGAGVDIEEGDALVDFIRKFNPAIGGFSGLAALPPGMKSPRLVMSTDGVGTKLLVAQLAGIHDTIGIDLVAMVVNDIIVCGARPLWFLDYFATGKLESGIAQKVLRGIIAGCKEAGCELVGGETAEMPGMYAPGHYDLAGFGVGAVEAARAIDGARVKRGDVILGLGSSGLHSNGYSLARRVLLPADDAAARRTLKKPFRKGSKKTLAEVMLEPTIIYVRAAFDLCARFPIGAMAHITGGGIEGNLSRVLPRGVRACIKKGSWPVPEVFDEIARRGPVEEEEMFRVFNMGIGYIVVVPQESAAGVAARCGRLGQRCYPIGWVDKGSSTQAEAEVLLLS
ncbi:phosphoribosylformylglycinamidine cyclo-ligase [Candidatus Sumerlaeota bacterium]|nr:phosphoribosylformylglycinamidine cyclo-ligase [Candidatus Sumerlaeota bacterium]